MAVVLDGEGNVHAIGDTCTHGEISLSEGFVDGDTLECWAHGSAFSLCTGKPLTFRLTSRFPFYVVEIEDGDIFIDPTVTKEIEL